MFFFEFKVNPAVFSPFPTFFSLPHAPAPLIFSVLGFQLYLIRSGSRWRLKESKCKLGRSAWPLEAGDKMWECNMETLVASLLSSNRRRHCEDRPSEVSAVTGNILDQNSTLQNKVGVSLFSVFFAFSAYWREIHNWIHSSGGYTIQADSGSCLSRAEILQKCCTECLDNWLATKNVCRSANCDAHYMLLLARGTVPYYHIWQMGSHSSLKCTFAESKTFSVHKKLLRPHFQHSMPDASECLNDWVLAFLQHVAKLILTEAWNLQQFRRRVKTVSDEAPTQVSVMRCGHPSWAVQSLQIKTGFCNLGFIEKHAAMWAVHGEPDSALMWDFCCGLAGDIKS